MKRQRKSLLSFGCASIIFSGIFCGFPAVLYFAAKEGTGSQKFDWGLVALMILPTIYMMWNWRYIAPPMNATPEQINLGLGRILCFLLFPSFSYLITLAIGYVMGSFNGAPIAGLIGGWIIAKLLQKTLFAYDYVRRDLKIW
jgi:hypothetical protein